MKTITKMVKKYGNSGGVYVPNSWVGGKVKVELIDEPFSPKEILNKVTLEHIVSAILYGSYARKEITEGSDIDIILVTDEDAKIDVPDELKKKYDIQVKTIKEARNAMVHDPIFHKVIMDESMALINHQFLDSLRKETLKPGGIRTRIELAESSLGIDKEIFEAGSEEIVYPLIMRLKEMLILEYLLANKKYSTSALKSEILNCGIAQKEFSGIMNIYRAARNNKKPEKYWLSRKTIEKLISLLETKIQYVRQKAQKKGC
jgi:predicted nucleotidyltransferase